MNFLLDGMLVHYRDTSETVVPGHVGGEVRHENLVSRQVDKCKTFTIKIYRS